MAKDDEKVYVVGYGGKGQIVYGKDASEGVPEYCSPMNLVQARNKISELGSIGADRFIYELVPVECSVSKHVAARTPKGRNGK